ncbi:TatD family hydrolase [Bermanella marisrubri]|uniref:TatD related DNase n=1 Tax=Bermanella marisrubri TaxID=207949 RepID=Q1N1P1_9GAMM|nr:TatD family hydrolase [Bermanella marisrubri]EAT12240.1 TatD related DNase [Oceanobacter sp. RED65] [Bermanella marisrubri]QIZ83708.1 TatD family hydrolase [Bermanella marisrubri]
MSKSKKRPIPVFDHPIIETHCHLDYLKEQSIEDTVATAAEKNIEKIITIAVSGDNLETVMDIATKQNLDRVYGTQGIHPHQAEDFNDDVEKQIRSNAQHERIRAIGEIGLDYFYDHCDREIQLNAFRKQLQIASEMDLPVVIHSREADEDTITVLKEFESTLKRRGVIHSFTSGPGLAQYAIEQGFYLGFNGICTFNKAENVRDIIRMTPLDNIILETDSPYLTPVPYRGKENAPCYIPFVAEKVAEVKGITVEELLPIAYQNSQALFF